MLPLILITARTYGDYTVLLLEAMLQYQVDIIGFFLILVIIETGLFK